jgi:PKHD-type hydroxylase
VRNSASDHSRFVDTRRMKRCVSNSEWTNAMMVHIPDVLTPDELAHCRERLQRSSWGDGRVTAGHQSVRVKNNLQLPEDDVDHVEIGAIVTRALQRHPLFISAALPLTIFPPLFNRYDTGMTFGSHVDNSVRQSKFVPVRIRTDVSATLFFSAPEDYDGGELVVEDTYGHHSVKLPAGDMIIYPSTSLHHVTPITRGARICSFFWVQSMIRDVTQRGLLFDLDMAIMRLANEVPDNPALVSLTAVYHNLLRQWAEV